MTIEARVRCVGCSADLGPCADGADNLPPICGTCAVEDEVIGHLAAAWSAERRVRHGRERVVSLASSEEVLVLTGLETLELIEALLPQGAGERLAPVLEKFRQAFRDCGPYSHAMAAAVRVNADVLVRGLFSPELRADVERLRGRLVRTEQALNDAETRAAMANHLADERFRRFADDVRERHPN